MVRCGEWDTKGNQEPYPHQDRRVMRVTKHPSYNVEKNYENDVALLHLAQEFELGRHIDTACLPNEMTGEDGFDPDNCYASGWGKKDFSGLNIFQQILSKKNDGFYSISLVSHQKTSPSTRRSCSRRPCRWSSRTIARRPSGPPGWGRSSSCTTRSCALEGRFGKENST